MRRMAVVVAPFLLLVLSLRSQGQQPAPFSEADLVGTWTLTASEPGEDRKLSQLVSRRRYVHR